MKALIKIILCLIINCAFSVTSSAQDTLPPYIDNDNWELDTGLSDEFNGSFKTSVWYTINVCQSGHGMNWGEGGFFNANNVTNSATDLILTATPNATPYSESTYPCSQTTGHWYHPYFYYTGGLLSHEDLGFGHGYYEIRAKLPGNYSIVNGIPVGKGFGPTFWLYYDHYTGNGVCKDKHDEFNILEPSATQYEFADFNEAGIHDESGDSCTFFKVVRAQMTSPVPLFSDYHTYGMELLSDRLIFYFDNNPVSWVLTNPDITQQQFLHALDLGNPGWLYVVLDLQLAYSVQPDAGIDWNSLSAHSMMIDYFHYYKFKPDTSSDDNVNDLSQNFPNPFRNGTEISYRVDEKAKTAMINFYNLQGILVKSLPINSFGKSKLQMKEIQFTSGVYFYSLKVNDHIVSTKRMIIIKD
jgi:beta-glucanase (GH16 family)